MRDWFQCAEPKGLVFQNRFHVDQPSEAIGAILKTTVPKDFVNHVVLDDLCKLFVQRQVLFPPARIDIGLERERESTRMTDIQVGHVVCVCAIRVVAIRVVRIFACRCGTKQGSLGLGLRPASRLSHALHLAAAAAARAVALVKVAKAEPGHFCVHRLVALTLLLLLLLLLAALVAASGPRLRTSVLVLARRRRRRRRPSVAAPVAGPVTATTTASTATASIASSAAATAAAAAAASPRHAQRKRAQIENVKNGDQVMTPYSVVTFVCAFHRTHATAERRSHVGDDRHGCPRRWLAW